MPNNLFVISGSSGGGKSSLIEELGRRGFDVVPEAGRQLVREQQAVGGVALPGTELFGHLLLSRSMYLYNQAVAAAQGKPVFFDRSVMEPIAYYHSVAELAPHHEQIAAQYRYATDVFMVPPWPEIFTKDKERLHSYDPNQNEYARLQQAFPAFGYRLIEIPKLGIEARADFVESHLKSIGVL